MNAHKFPNYNDPEATCTYCGLKSKNEHKKPECKRHPKALKASGDPIPAKGKGSKAKSTKGKGESTWGRCYEKHPVLEIGGGRFIGGSCTSPVTDKADVYIGFQSGMKHTNRRFPWWPGHEIEFKVTDYQAPRESEAEQYIALVDWTVEMLGKGLTIHAGCIGGHGRTGMFLAAILARLGEERPIAHARAHYCKKAVESAEQVKFLAKHFGCEADAKAAKERTFTSSKSGSSWDSDGRSWSTGSEAWQSPVSRYRDRYGTPKAPEKSETITPTPGASNVWGRTLDPEDY